MLVKVNPKSNNVYELDLSIVETKKGEVIRVGTHRHPQVKEYIIKGLQDCKWKGGSPPNWKKESCYYEAPLNSRNIWHLNYHNAETGNPYDRYRIPLTEFDLKPRYSKRLGKIVEPMPHQREMANHWFTRKRCHIAADMRTGKTLPMLSVAEHLGLYTWIVAPRSAVAGVKLEIYNWGFDELMRRCEIMTYNELVSLLKKTDITTAIRPPQVIVFDECHMLKNWTTERTKAAFHVTDNMREHYGDECWILGMSGTPAPKNPVDLWSQIEVICPGYIAEPSPKQLEARLAIIEYKDNETGGQYPVRVAWRDSSNICNTCGLGKDQHYPWDHEFVPGKDELGAFRDRLQGMSIRFRKSDCMSLPEKIMEVIEVKPTKQVLKYASIIKKSGKSPAVILNELAQLSAGFYYEMVPDESRLVECNKCWGSKKIENTNGDLTVDCDRCDATGQMHPLVRVAQRVDCPKKEAMIELLEECEPSLRFVGFGGFEGCIDIMVEIALEQEWNVIRIDGRGFSYFGAQITDSIKDDQDALMKFGNINEFNEKLAVIAHPGTGGTGVSYSSSPTIMYWHNPFDGAARMQSIERGTDANMDMSRGCKIVDLVQLPVDKYVLENLDNKQKLQEVTLSVINDL